MSRYTVNSAPALQTAIGDIREAYRVHRYVTVTVKVGKPRSLSQNDCSFAWYQQLARELKEDDAQGWRRFCKLTIGVPILRAEDAHFRECYDAVIKPLDHERKLIAMDHWPVTSLMTVAQLSKFLDNTAEHFRDEHGVTLERPKIPDEVPA